MHCSFKTAWYGQKGRSSPGSGVDLDRFKPHVVEPRQQDFRFLLIGRLLWDKGIRDSRTRPAAPATSSTRSCARDRVDWALSAVAWKVRSTAVRTAPTASAGLLSFFDFFLSFFAMARASLVLLPALVATSPIHLRPNAPVAERALLPGDPGRALRLAQHLLAAPMQVLNTNRGLWGYTGTAADGAPLTIQSTGMGGPSAAIVAEELIALGARRLVRVGTCGAFAGGPRLGELLVAGEALCADGASRALGAGERAAADPGLMRRAGGRGGRPGHRRLGRPLLRPRRGARGALGRRGSGRRRDGGGDAVHRRAPARASPPAAC